MDPRIGELMREGKTVYYAMIDGRCVEGSLDRVEVALGMRKPVRTLRVYNVTVTPRFKQYAGSWASGEYTVEVSAYDRAGAIKEARREYNADSWDNPATYRASLAK